MNRIYQLIFIFTLSFTSLQAQPPVLWTGQIGGAAWDQLSSSHMDSQDNLYTAGSFAQTADLNSDTATSNFTAQSGTDGFVTKADQNGNHQWAAAFHSQGSCIINGVTTDVSNNVYVAGTFSTDIDVNPDPNTTTTVTGQGGDDMFLVKLDAAGNYIWHHTFGQASSQRIQKIASDSQNNIYIAGLFSGDIDMDPGAGTHIISSGITLDLDMFLAKYDSAGNLQWANAFGGDLYTETIHDLHVDASGNIYFSGEFADSLDFDPDTTTYILTGDPSVDGFSAKYNTNGELQWALHFYSVSLSGVRATQPLPNGNVLITGTFRDQIDLDPGTGNAIENTQGNNDVFAVFIDSNGVYQSHFTFGDPGIQTSMGIEVSTSGRVFIHGAFNGTVDFDPGSGTASSAAQGNSDSYILEIDQSGNYVDHWIISGSIFTYMYFLNSDANDNLYMSIAASADVDLDPGPGTVTQTSFGNWDIHLAKLGTGTFAGRSGQGWLGDAGMVVYPNPAGDRVSVEIMGEWPNEISLYSADGVEILRVDMRGAKAELDLSDLPSGIYFLRGIVDGRMISSRIVRHI